MGNAAPGAKLFPPQATNVRVARGSTGCEQLTRMMPKTHKECRDVHHLDIGSLGLIVNGSAVEYAPPLAPFFTRWRDVDGSRQLAA